MIIMPLVAASSSYFLLHAHTVLTL